MYTTELGRVAASTWGGVGGLLPIIVMLMAGLELGKLLYSVACTTWNILKSINIFRDNYNCVGITLDHLFSMPGKVSLVRSVYLG